MFSVFIFRFLFLQCSIFKKSDLIFHLTCVHLSFLVLRSLKETSHLSCLVCSSQNLVRFHLKFSSHLWFFCYVFNCSSLEKPFIFQLDSHLIFHLSSHLIFQVSPQLSFLRILAQETNWNYALFFEGLFTKKKHSPKSFSLPTKSVLPSRKKSVAIEVSWAFDCKRKIAVSCAKEITN